MSSNNRGEAAFSLVEAMVALAVFAMAGVALVTLQTQSLRTFTMAEQRSLAEIVAQNRMVEITTTATAPELGVQHGDVTFAGRPWIWNAEIAPTQDPRTLRVIVVVNDAQSGAILARKLGFTAADGSPMR